ncbi:uncharacterized protein EAF02_006816 [Botrytis sinoallii]|uniref:uncharacterized protein n=1 Tax=Botrytis sinoallii TaxID=1463999 RepID=UPI0019021D2F|nr:uncharacterized protein EAF02_006816 [Botrytis sinoallii]KAF7880925.1 hypothetical protein EAF02_006816 [Botrytis sinoallii]
MPSTGSDSSTTTQSSRKIVRVLTIHSPPLRNVSSVVPRKSGVARCFICLTLYMAMARTKRKHVRTQESSGTSKSIHAGDSNFGV